MIKVRNYHKAYDTTIAVKSLSFQVDAGTVLGLVGPNGAGKTTTMRAIAGIIPPTSGLIQVGDFDVVKQPKQSKQISSLIPDDPKLFDSLTVWEHLRFVAAAYQVPDFEPQAEELLQLFELTEKRTALARELSRGMRQKVAICCAYLQNPKVIMFDEPHTGLDPLAIRRMKSTIQERAMQGAAVIVSSHLLSLIEDLCSHLLILCKGESQFCGTLDELRAGYPELEQGTSLEEIFFKATAADTSFEEDGPNNSLNGTAGTSLDTIEEEGESSASETNKCE